MQKCLVAGHGHGEIETTNAILEERVMMECCVFDENSERVGSSMKAVMDMAFCWIKYISFSCVEMPGEAS